MPNVLLGKSLSFKYMTKMTFAVRAYNFYSLSISIWYSLDLPRNLVVKAGPSAMTDELVCGHVQR